MEISSSVSCVRHSVGEITVLVKDSAGSAVPGASVSILGTSGTTDSAGKARLRMADGGYTVVAQKSGYFSTSASADVSCASFHTLDVLPSVSCGKTAAECATVLVAILYDDLAAKDADVALEGATELGRQVSRSDKTARDGKARFVRVENGTYSASASFNSLDTSTDFEVSCAYALPPVPGNATTGPTEPGENATANVTGNATGPVNATVPTATANATAGLTIEDIVGSTANATRDIMGGMLIFATSARTAPIAVAIIVVAAVLGYALARKPGLLPFMRKK
jgi:hypothetical protein